MPKERYDENYRFLPGKEYLEFDEIERLVNLFTQAGVSKVRITGGEPLLRKDLDRLIARISTVNGVTDLAMITNGYLLGKAARRLKAAGLGRITVSLDSLDADVFGEINGRGYGLRKVLEGIEVAAEEGLAPIKINVVIQRFINDDSVLEFARFARNTGHIVRFIEYMDVGNCNNWKYREVVPSAELRERIHNVFPIVPANENYRGEVANRYLFADGGGEIGFISSVSRPFCGQCTRARLSADGILYACLFANRGLDLKQLLRGGISDEKLLETIISFWNKRDDRYSEERAFHKEKKKIEMYHIGG